MSQRHVSASAFVRGVLLCSLLLVPAAARAQLMPVQDDVTWGARLRVTPFLAWAPSVTRHETWSYQDGADTYRADTEYKLGAGKGAGLNISYGVHGPFSVFAGGLYLQRDDAQFSLGGETPYLYTGSDNLSARLGLSMQLRERESDMMFRRMGAEVFLAPFLLMEMPQEMDNAGDTGLFDTATHFGVNFGAAGELPFAADRLAFQFGFEDYLTWWDEDALALLPTYLRTGNSAAANPTVVSADATHQFLLRAGISFRFR